MSIKKTKIDTQIEKQILIGMVISGDYLKEILPVYHPDLFENRYSHIIAGWCKDYFQKYGTAPKEAVREIFENWENSAQPEQAKYVGGFLANLSDEYEHAEKFNVKYLLDKSLHYFKKQSLKLLAEDLNFHLNKDDIQSAEEAMGSFRKVEKLITPGIDPFQDVDAIRNSFSQTYEPLFPIPGELGRMMTNQFTRNSFIVLLGPEKRGKCISFDTPVILSDGRLKPICEVVKDKDAEIITLDESTMRFVPWKIADHWNNGVKDCLRLETRTGRKVTTTPNHPYLTPNGWKRVEELSVGDKIAVPRNIPCFGDKPMIEHRIKLLAYLLAEGCLTDRTCPVFTSTYPDIQKDFVQSVKRMGDNITQGDYKTFYVVNCKEKIGKHDSNNTVNWFRELGIMEKKSAGKFIPEPVFQLPKPQLSLFLNILFSCDGSIFKGGIEYCSASERMSREIYHLLLRFGVVSKLTARETSGVIYWTISIRDKENILKFIDEIGFSFHKAERAKVLLEELKLQKRSNSFLDSTPYEIIQKIYEELNGIIPNNLYEAVRNSRINKANLSRGMVKQLADLTASHIAKNTAYGDILWDEIISIEDAGKIETYDLSVGTHHNFIAADMVVHNTWWLMFLGMQAHKAKCNVAEFQVGDMSEDQRVRRQHISLARKSDKPKYCGPLLVPVLDCEYNQKDMCDDRNRTCGFGVYEDGEILTHEEAGDYKLCTYCSGKSKKFKGAIWHTKRPEVEPLNWREAYKVSQDYLKRVRPKGYRLSTHSSRSINVAGIRSQLELWERTDGFIPDVIIIDYIDILAAEPNCPSEERHRKNETNMALRKLSQDYDCCVISATQADAASYYQKAITKSNFSEDKRIFGHVTAMFALNQTIEEKRKGLMRLAPLVIREDDYDESFNVTVGQCLAIGAPYLFSYIGEN